MVPLGLADEVTLEAAEDFVFSCSDPSLPADDSNLAVRAARVFAERTNRPRGVRIHLEKHTPHGAGLGGGSSDAAAVLLALNGLHSTGLGSDDLAALAAELGSDVPFFIYEAPAWCMGRGEIVEPCAFPQALPVLLVKPPFPVPTPAAYKDWAKSRELPGIDYTPQELSWGTLQNDLERPVFEKYVFLAALKTWLRAQPEVEGALLSGSGSTMFAVLRDATEGEPLAARTRAHFGESLWTCVTRVAVSP